MGAGLGPGLCRLSALGRSGFGFAWGLFWWFFSRLFGGSSALWGCHNRVFEGCFRDSRAR